MINQLQITTGGQILDKAEIAIQRLKAFEPTEGYYLCMSGGKDSQCVYHLCQMAGVKFDAHYNVTSCDPPELVQFLKNHYPDVKFQRNHDKDGNPITMWSLIPKNRMPPTRMVRYCCEELKEYAGAGRIIVTGVRWAESANRKNNQGLINVFNPSKRQWLGAENVGAEFWTNKSGGLIMNDDNDASRRIVEFCYRTNKTMVNPIVDWEDDDVWGFLNGNGIPHCSLYDEGFKRLGCIGCPMARGKRMRAEFERWPAYEKMYRRAFERMIAERIARGLPCEWKTADDVMKWWLNET